ncbi:hypothetical protein BV898_18799 [Hypsibius exemplaris]|uniref:Uncharacterized protein n=1 Tax=Hypsibius exemplaris TaxID=2072580 RepID=A0A9X6RNU6_HYPEX|nr:hypothetical protein BV898_18799 [Hypsibius exemplaris]
MPYETEIFDLNLKHSCTAKIYEVHQKLVLILTNRRLSSQTTDFICTLQKVVASGETLQNGEDFEYPVVSMDALNRDRVHQVRCFVEKHSCVHDMLCNIIVI